MDCYSMTHQTGDDERTSGQSSWEWVAWIVVPSPPVDREEIAPRHGQRPAYPRLVRCPWA